MLRSDLYGYSDAYIVVGLINFKADIEKKDHVLKNNAPFVLCIKKVNKHINSQCRRSQPSQNIVIIIL